MTVSEIEDELASLENARYNLDRMINEKRQTLAALTPYTVAVFEVEVPEDIAAQLRGLPAVSAFHRLRDMFFPVSARFERRAKAGV